jgi:hypothetical protein
MKEVILAVVGLLLLIAGLCYLPSNDTNFYKETRTVCRSEKGWGYVKYTSYCMQAVPIPEEETQTFNINLQAE